MSPGRGVRVRECLAQGTSTGKGRAGLEGLGGRGGGKVHALRLGSQIDTSLCPSTCARERERCATGEKSIQSHKRHRISAASSKLIVQLNSLKASRWYVYARYNKGHKNLTSA